MALFEKKTCSVCGGKIGLMGNRKLDDGNMCKDCASRISPFFADRRRTTLADMLEHLAQRDANLAKVAEFNPTRSFGDRTKLHLDDGAGRFIVTSSNRWAGENPDVIELSQVTGCRVDVRENKTELKTKDADGKSVPYVPPRFEMYYDYDVVILINSPWFSEIRLRVNRGDVRRGSPDVKECELECERIRAALSREAPDASPAPSRTAQVCPHCGATCVPDARGLCEYCGGAMGG